MKSIVFLLLIFVTCSITFSQHITVTAHRGASGYAPENTIASFKKAIELGADFSELDAQETSDGVLIVNHDGNYKRTAESEKNVWET